MCKTLFGKHDSKKLHINCTIMAGGKICIATTSYPIAHEILAKECFKGCRCASDGECIQCDRSMVTGIGSHGKYVGGKASQLLAQFVHQSPFGQMALGCRCARQVLVAAGDCCHGKAYYGFCVGLFKFFTNSHDNLADALNGCTCAWHPVWQWYERC